MGLRLKGFEGFLLRDRQVGFSTLGVHQAISDIICGCRFDSRVQFFKSRLTLTFEKKIGSSPEDVSATVLVLKDGENFRPSDKSLVSSFSKGWSVRLTTALVMTFLLGLTTGALCLNNPESVGWAMLKDARLS